MLKNTKRVFALILAFAVIAMSMFTGFAVSAADPVETPDGIIDLLEFGAYLTDAGSASQYYDTKVADNGETGDSWDNAIIIDSAEEFVYLAKASGNETAGKYYKVADGIAGFNLSSSSLDINGTLEDNLDIIKGSGKNHTGGTPGFQGHFDGNGVTVYGAWTSDINVSSYAGLFSCTQGDVTIKNVNVKLSYFVGKSAAGGIVGYHRADTMATLTIENCSVTDCYIETQGTGWATGVGAILGYGASAPSYVDSGTGKTVYVNVAYNIKNCYVNLDETYFVSPGEDGTESSGERVCHGGVAGVLGSNALSVSDCIVIGITPYATSESTGYNDVQHTGLESHFANVYTTSDVVINPVNLGGTGVLDNRDFTGKIFQLSDAQMKGAAAIENMDLDWSVWMADDEGYPELAVSHKNVTLVDNKDGTHSETCACGFGGIAVDHNFVAGECACGAELNCAARKTIYWDGTVATGIATGTGTKADPYIIKTAAELAWLVQQKADVTADKYYEIDESIGAIVLQSADKAEAIKGLADAAAVKAYFESESGLVEWVEVGWEQSSFCGDFDGNGVTVYGLYSVSANNAGLFSTVDAGAAFHNIALKNSYLTSTANNYQVGGIAAVTSGNSYGRKTVGAIWFDGCVVANNYMYNLSDSHDRSGVIIGSSLEVTYIDNCLVYGNDATYGAGVVMPIASSSSNSTIVNDSLVAPDGLELVYQENCNSNGDSMYYNMIRNSIILGAKPYDLAQIVGSRFNDPKCYVNVLTDADVATDTFGGTDKVLGATDEQIKTVTLADLATAELGSAWLNTATYPELKAFHDAEFTLTDNGDGTHSVACSCGLGGVAEKHVYSDGVCECNATCGHSNKADPVQENSVDPTCTAAGSYESVVYCVDCGVEVSRDTVPVDATGHTNGDAVVENRVESTCTTKGSYDSVVYCTVCEEEVSRTSVELELDPNAHTYDNAEDADCNDCGAVRKLFTYGDVNDDGDINNKDLVLLMQRINEWDVTVNESAADVNADGAINNKDYVLIMQSINEWPVTFGPQA